MYSNGLSRSFCYVLTEFARLDCVIISFVIRLTSVSGPWSRGTLVIPTGNRSAVPDLDYIY